MNNKDSSKHIDVYEHLEVLALHSVSTGKDPSYVYRKICRWFSREFHTPLPQVIKLPVEFVLQNYYEYQFESLQEEELFKIMRYHADPDYVETQKSDDDEFFRQVQEEVEKVNKAKTVKLQENETKDGLEKQSYSEEENPERTVTFKDLDEKNET